MSSANARFADRVTGGEFLRSLDLPAKAAESAGPSPGMLTGPELAMLSEIVRWAWRGNGVIVDGGSFLGSSLVAEAQGMPMCRSSVASVYGSQATSSGTAFPGIDRTAQLMLALSRVHLMLYKGSQAQALEQLQETAVEYVDILGVISQSDSYKPTPGAPDTRLPRYRMDRTVTEVLSGPSVRGPRVAGDTSPAAPDPPNDLDRARVALSHRDWDEARRLLQPLVAAEPFKAAGVLLARTELESGRPDVAAAMLDDLLARRPRHQRARALRARVRLVTGDHAGATAQAEEALQADPDLVMARRVLFDVSVAERLRDG